MGASPLGGMPSGCAASKSIGDQFVFPMISVVSGIRNALDLLDLSVLPTAIRVGRRRRIRFGFLTALLGLVASTVGKGKLRPHVASCKENANRVRVEPYLEGNCAPAIRRCT